MNKMEEALAQPDPPGAVLDEDTSILKVADDALPGEDVDPEQAAAAQAETLQSGQKVVDAGGNAAVDHGKASGAGNALTFHNWQPNDKDA